MPPRLAVIALLLGSLGFGTAAAQSPSQDEVLDRLGAYLLVYEEQLATLVAEERYEQSSGDRRRTLTSEFGFLRLPGRREWLGLRDTFLVDGQPVRPRDARLERLLADGSPETIEQLRQGIVDQNTRYNLGDVARTINVPMLALDLLHPRHRWRFRFRHRGEAHVNGRELWLIEFEERERPTVVRTPQGENRPAEGVAWVAPLTGAVVRTELRLGGGPRASFVVRYEHDAGVGLLVPVEMHERYEADERDPATIHALATYSNFRRFQSSGRIVVPR